MSRSVLVMFVGRDLSAVFDCPYIASNLLAVKRRSRPEVCCAASNLANASAPEPVAIKDQRS
jgi:hypothetical protein